VSVLGLPILWQKQENNHNEKVDRIEYQVEKKKTKKQNVEMKSNVKHLGCIWENVVKTSVKLSTPFSGVIIKYMQDPIEGREK